MVGIRRVPRSELLERLRATGSSYTADIVALRRMTSGDLLIRTAMEAARIGLEGNTDWLRTLSGSAGIKRKIYTVMAHRIRVARVDASNQRGTIAQLVRENCQLHPGLPIERVTWPQTVEGKTYSTLLVDTHSPEVANKLINEGLLFDLQIHTCKVFNRAARLTQCFRCQAYGHVARACRSSEKCAHCAGAHSTKECCRANDHSKMKCANCHQTGHAAWMKACAVRDQEISRLYAVRMNTPAKFQGGGQHGALFNPLESVWPPTRADRTPPSSQRPQQQQQSPPPPPRPAPRIIAKHPRSNGGHDSEAVSSGSGGDESGPSRGTPLPNSQNTPRSSIGDTRQRPGHPKKTPRLLPRQMTLFQTSSQEERPSQGTPPEPTQASNNTPE